MIYAHDAGAIELLSGILLVVGPFTGTAAVVLVIFRALTIIYFHDFWAVDMAQLGAQRTRP